MLATDVSLAVRKAGGVRAEQKRTVSDWTSGSEQKRAQLSVASLPPQFKATLAEEEEQPSDSPHHTAFKGSSQQQTRSVNFLFRIVAMGTLLPLWIAVMLCQPLS